MFFDGNLQAGIARALQDNKPVACFVRDDGEESRTWEHNGQLVAHLQPGMEFQDFRAAVVKALSRSKKDEAGKNAIESATSGEDEARMSDTDPPSSNDPSIASPYNGTDYQGTTVLEAPTLSDTTPPRAVAPHSQASTADPESSTLQQVMADRRRRLEADKAAKDTAEKEKRRAVAQARREAASAAPGTPVSKQLSYAQAQRKRQQEAKEERQRILKAIENDKAERKEKEAQRRALAETELAEAASANRASKSANQRIPKDWGLAAHAQQCSLQIRLLDGTIIRRRFEPQQTLNNDVRPWLAGQRTDGDTPYTFKQILTPQLNRAMSISEEEESLQSLGLLPSATLVMVPIQGYTDVYASNQGMMGKAWSVGYNAASAGGSMLKGALRTVLGIGRATPETQGVESEGKRDETSSDNDRQTAAHGGVKYRTLNRQRDGGEDHELYNGNQVRETLQSDNS
ncbi:MAG: hypothetical protein LQ343_001865 [Gyalolechia ehrenbergii]|nr:MAG: hypothetical protein LQ343_001865 [Gyalolechia ehrenbergii]